MPRRPARDLTVGIVAALALAIVAFAIMAVGGESRFFAAKRTYRVVFPNTVGLVVGSPVLIAGVQVGTVTEIHLPTAPSEPGIRVRIGVERTYAERVREDSRAALRISQLLSGEKYVEVTPGDPESAILEEDDEIPLVQETALLEQGKDIAENLNAITVTLQEILGPLESGEGLLGQMIHDPEFGKEGLDRLKGTLENLQALTRQLRRGEGFIGRALYDEGFEAKIDDLSGGIERFAALMESLAARDGALGPLLEEGGAGELAIEDLKATAASLRRSAERLEAPEGLLGRLLHDPEYSARLAEDVETTLANLAEITGKINAGEGTLGALVNERVVHDGMEDVVAGVNDSKFARWLARHYQKKGIKARDREAKKRREDETR